MAYTTDDTKTLAYQIIEEKRNKHTQQFLLLLLAQRHLISLQLIIQQMGASYGDGSFSVCEMYE